MTPAITTIDASGFQARSQDQWSPRSDASTSVKHGSDSRIGAGIVDWECRVCNRSGCVSDDKIESKQSPGRTAEKLLLGSESQIFGAVRLGPNGVRKP
jgi:hypothetical protein